MNKSVKRQSAPGPYSKRESRLVSESVNGSLNAGMLPLFAICTIPEFINPTIFLIAIQLLVCVPL